MLLVFALFIATALSCPFANLMKARGVKFSEESLKNFHAKQELEKRNVEQVKVTQTFVLTSRVKTPSSLVFGQGFPVGFAVNGFETPEINLIAGKTYNFTVMSGCNHPFYLAFDVRGKGRSPVTEGWQNNKPPTPFIGGNNAICGGKSILWTPPESLITTNAGVKQIYYHCFVHDNMGWKVNIKKQSFCDKYTDRLSSVVSNNAGLVGAVVDRAFAALTDPKNDLIDYFNGEVPSGSTDFTNPANSMQTAKLANNLVTFFGAALGCSDGSIGAYTGGDMRTVHAAMPIGSNEFDSFVSKLAKILTDFNVESNDLKDVAALLNSADVRGKICNVQADCFESICNKYSTKKNGVIEADANKVLMNAIVDKSFAKVLADPVLITYFNGVKPAGSTDFTKDAAKTQALKDRFAAFIGSPPVFGCTDPKFPPTTYSIADLKTTHFFMGIGPADFNKFNDLVIAAVAELGVMPADQVLIRQVLNSTEPLICTAPGCSTVPLATNAKIYDVTVAPKVMGHHYFGKGFSAAFKLDGQTVEGLNLEVGKEYGFRSNVSCFHPFYVSDGTGSGSPETQDGVTQGFGDNTCAGKTLIFKPTAAQMGKKLFYACRNHDLMGGALCIVAPGTNTPCTVSGGAAPAPESLSPCDDLVQAVKQRDPTATAATVIKDVVIQTFTKGVGSPLKKFFDGTQPPGSTDFTMPGANQDRLVTGLVKFFATNLGCTDNSVVLYKAGDALPDMKTIHQNMNIDKDSFDLFNTVLAGELTKFKGNAYGMSAANAAKAYSFLNATSPDICAGCADYNGPSLCEKWAIASKTFNGDQKKMVTAVVVGVFNKLIADPPTKALFDGTVPCKSRNFVTDKINQGGLVTTLVAFFGQPGVLGCTQSDYPQFRGNSDMEAVHREMPITKAMYDLFVSSLVSVVTDALKADVPSLATDLMPVAALFKSPQLTVICNQPDCPATKGMYSERCPATTAGTTKETTKETPKETPKGTTKYVGTSHTHDETSKTTEASKPAETTGVNSGVASLTLASIIALVCGVVALM